MPNVDLPPLCSSRFRPGPPGEQAQAASQFIADVIERYSHALIDPLSCFSSSACIFIKLLFFCSSELIKAEDLCIERGKVICFLHLLSINNGS